MDIFFNSKKASVRSIEKELKRLEQGHKKKLKQLRSLEMNDLFGQIQKDIDAVYVFDMMLFNGKQATIEDVSKIDVLFSDISLTLIAMREKSLGEDANKSLKQMLNKIKIFVNENKKQIVENINVKKAPVEQRVEYIR